MRKLLIGCLLFSALYTVTYAQENPRISKKDLIVSAPSYGQQLIIDHLENGDKYYRKGIYDRAFRHYYQLYEMVSFIPELNYKLGVSALLGGSEADAVTYLLGASSSVAGDYYYYLGKANQAVYNYGAAKDAFTMHHQSLGRLGQRRFEDEYIQLINEGNFGQYAVQDSLPYFIINLGPAVNSYYDEYGAVEHVASSFLYMTGRKPERLPEKPVNRDTYRERLFKAEYNNGEASETTTVPSPSSSWRHVAVAGLDASNDLLFVYHGKNRSGQLRSSKITDKRLRGSKRLKGAVDRKVFQETGISAADNGDAYFVSDKPGGEGGMDIWYAKRKGKNKYRKAENVGDRINTMFDEKAVYVTSDGNTLYFASNGLSGLGGFDIYKCERQPDASWGDPVNLGYPINSSADDLYYHPTSDSLVALMASNRAGGFGGLDIYQVKKDPRIPFEVWGEVRDVNDGSILPGRITIIDLSENLPVAYAESDSLSGEYYLQMEDVGNYAIQADVTGYKSWREALEMPEQRNEKIRKDFELEKLLFPYSLWGNITNEATGHPIQAQILIKSLNDEVLINSGYSSVNTGYYSVTMADKANVLIEVTAEDFYGRTLQLYKDKMLGDNGELNIALASSKQIFTLTGVVSDEVSGNVVPAAIAAFEPGNMEPVAVSYADSVSGRYNLRLDNRGPLLLELTAEGYFFLNKSLEFIGDSTLLVRNYGMQPMSTGARIVVENILFTTGKATLRAESYSELNKLVRLLLENADVRIEVSGHTDNVGSASLNKRLSRSRAQSVKSYLESQGVDAGRIEFEGYGFDRPIAPNETPEGRAANRRVEIEVIE
jgi:outer membrane protein OmpA-like peptidoglycan-associated protein